MNIVKNIVVVEREKTSLEFLKNFLDKIFKECAVNVFENEKDAILFCTKYRPQLVFLSAQRDENETITTIEKLVRVNPDCKIVIQSYKYNSQSIFNFMRAGAAECLTKPVLEDDLVKLKQQVFDNSAVKNNEAKIISIFSNKGGLGKTSIAINLAHELSKFSGKKIVLLDLNLQFGDIAAFLAINPKFDISYIAKNIDKQDETSIWSFLEQYKNKNLYVISNNYNENNNNLLVTQLKNMLSVLKKYADFVIVDLSQNIDTTTMSILTLSDLIFLVANMHLPSLYHTQQCIKILKQNDINDEKIEILINRYIDNTEISINDIEKILNKKVFAKIPNNYITQLQAINKGVSVCEISENSNLAICYRELAKLTLKRFK